VKPVCCHTGCIVILWHRNISYSCCVLSCAQLEILVPLENLLEHESVRVQTCANASLYSLLREPAIRLASETHFDS